MKIQQITANYPKASTNFKGLNGNTESKWHGIDSQGVNQTTLETQYHPFLDESSRDIKNAQKKHNGVTMQDYSHSSDLESRNLVVGERLRFTKSEFEQYKRGELTHSKNASKRALADTIENNLRKLNLQKFLK